MVEYSNEVVMDQVRQAIVVFFIQNVLSEGEMAAKSGKWNQKAIKKLIARTNALQNSLIAVYCREPTCITPSDVSTELFI